MKHQTLTAIIPMKGMKWCRFVLPITRTSQRMIGNDQCNVVVVVVVISTSTVTKTITTATVIMTGIGMLL